MKQAVEEAEFCMMVQNASAMLARTGLLFHRQVADYDYDENWKRMFTVGINYINGERLDFRREILFQQYNDGSNGHDSRTDWRYAGY